MHLLEPKYGEKYPQLVAALQRLDPQQVLGSVKARAPVNAGGYILRPEEVQVEITDIPLYEQYGTWLWQSLHLEFGNSLKVNRPITAEWLRFFPVTCSIAVLAGLMTMLTAVPLGIVSAVRQDRWVDYLGRTISIAGLSLPSFWVALLIILGLVIWFQWLPPLEYVPFWQAPLASLQQILFPGLCGSVCADRRDRPHDALCHAGGTARRLYPYSLGQGPTGASSGACATP